MRPAPNTNQPAQRRSQLPLPYNRTTMQYFQKLIQKDLGFTHNIADAIPSNDRADIWSLHHGSSKDNGDPSLVMHFDPAKSHNADRNQQLAKQGLMRLKTLRHPDILKFLTCVDGSDGTIYIATEPAVPLSTMIQNDPSTFTPETLQWGLFTISRALGFLHKSNLIHGRINTSTVFVTPSGDWKLGGLECVTPHNQCSQLAQNAKILQLTPYQSPEFASSNWSLVANAPTSSIDSWALGCLIFDVHSKGNPLTNADQLQNIQVLPKPILSAYQKLLASNTANRAPAGELENHPYFRNSKFIEFNLFIDNLALKGQLEREAFLNKLVNIMDKLPDSFCNNKIVPMLSQSIETNIGSSYAFSCILKLQTRLSDDQFYKAIVLKHSLKWFSSATIDKNIKIELFSHLSLFVAQLDDNSINTIIFPAMCNGFQDMQSPALRDASVKSVLNISAKLTDKNLNSILMSHFARLQVDPEPAIRTNTTVCLGKIAKQLSQNARTKVLAAAFVRSLKDPFPPARSAGCSAILASVDMYGTKEVATRMLPALVPLLVDASGDVRTLAFKLLADFEKRLTANHNDMLKAEAATAKQQQLNQPPHLQQNGSRDSATSMQSSAAAQSNAGAAGAGGWGLSTFTSMTAALLSKSDSGSSVGQAPSSTGISSDSFRSGASAMPSSVSSTSISAMKTNNAAPQTTSSTWGGGTNGTASSNKPPAHAQDTMGSFSSFGMDDSAEADKDDDDDDGWGDMDIGGGAESKTVDDEDLLASMLGTVPPPKSTGLGGVASKAPGVQKKTEGEDLWDLGPTAVSRPKAKAKGLGGTRTGRTSGLAGRRAGGGTDDWESLLGGPSTTSATSRRRGK